MIMPEIFRQTKYWRQFQIFILAGIHIQLGAKQTAPLVNKHYENEVTLRQQN